MRNPLANPQSENDRQFIRYCSDPQKYRSNLEQSSAQNIGDAANNARCPECNALLGTMGVNTPPHLPGCKWLSEYNRNLQNWSGSKYD